MAFLVNLIFAVLAYFVGSYIASALGARHPIPVLVGILLAIVVFLANFAARVL